MNDPFSDEEDGDELVKLALLAASAKTQNGNDEPKSLTEAKKSSEWPKWEHAIQDKLTQLHKKGTWKLVNTPANAVPIVNRWVFTKKYNKFGDLLKYKGRLVVKGCAHFVTGGVESYFIRRASEREHKTQGKAPISATR